MIILRILTCFLLLANIVACDDNSENTVQRSPTSVDVIQVKHEKYHPSVELPGRVRALKESEVRPQVTGIIQERLYTEGKRVTAGETLYKIDPATYEANVKNAEANLKKAKADRNVAQKTLSRYEELASKKLASQQDYDDAKATYEQAKAEVDVAKANLDYQNILLSYTNVKAPISGRIGISTVSEGALVTAEQSSYLTTIKQFDYVYVDMTQSSLELQKIRKDLIGLQKKDDTTVSVSIKLEDGSQYEPIGELESSDITVDESTSSVTLRAIIPNPKRQLLPGIFVRATIQGPEASNIILIPQRTVIRNTNGTPFVYVANNDNHAIKKEIKLGREVGTNWEILEGLSEGDKVIINGFQKLEDGAPITIDSVLPANQNTEF